MPYALFALGVLVGLYGLYRFFKNAPPRVAGTMILTLGTGAIVAALLILTLTGRLPVALAVLAALWPILAGMLKKRKAAARAPKPASQKMTRGEALEILGLKEGATPDDIQEAYKRLIMRTHPDQQGSEWIAAKLNEARDFLLK